MPDKVLVERRQGVLVMTLDRPEVRNAVDSELAQQLGDAISLLDEDLKLRVGVITGSGPVFCAGADLHAVAAGRSILPPDNPEWGFGGLVRRTVRKPLVAAVNGPAMGGGAELVLCCDIVVIAPQATLGLPEVRRGLIAGAGGLIRLPTRVPPNVALEAALTGEPLTATAVHAHGLANAIADDPLETALDIAERIAANAPRAVVASKAIIRASLAQPSPGDQLAWAINDPENAAIKESEDAREGAGAFLEKRQPNWTGR